MVDPLHAQALLTDAFEAFASAGDMNGQGRVEAYIDALQRELSALPYDPILERALAEARAEAAGR